MLRTTIRTTSLPPQKMHDSDSSDSEDEWLGEVVVPVLLIKRRLDEMRKRKARMRGIRRARSERRAFHYFGAIFVDEAFRRTYRMSRSSFEKLVSLMGPFLKNRSLPNATKGRAINGDAILTVREKVAISLRVLAGASYLDICSSYSIARSTVYSTFHRFLAICSSGCVQQLEISFPFDDDNRLRKLADDFAQATSNHSALYGCVGALDGLAVRIRRPTIEEASKPLDYFNRKGFFAINVQAICDSRSRFLYLSLETPGSTHDATAFAVSSFSKKWAAAATDDAKRKWWIAADDAYGATNNIITPWAGRRLDIFQDAFNFHLSGGNRNVIERAFGLLTQRWGILWRRLQVTLGRAPQVVVTCAALQNFIIGEKEQEIPVGMGPGAKRPAESFKDVSWQVQFQDDCATEVRPGSRRDHEKCPKRVFMTERLRSLGRIRPAVVKLRRASH